MSEIRQRNVGEGESATIGDDSATDEGKDSANDSSDPPGIDLKSAEQVPQGTDATPGVLESILGSLPPRWRNCAVRAVLGLFMISGLVGFVYLGPMALVVLILAIQIKCYHEIITIGYIVYKSNDLPWFRTLSWYFLVTSNYFFYGESLGDQLSFLQNSPLVTYHRFISFSMYCAGVVGFVLSLVKKHYLQQFTLFGWTHVTLLLIVTQSHLTMGNIFNGIIWFLVPVSMIICNDIMAYMFGFFFGKTPLIKLSPKKTWEGFIGGAVSTVLFGIGLSYLLVQFDFFVCPVEYSEAEGGLSLQCERSPAFLLTDYHLPFSLPLRTVRIYPFILHSISLSLFASIIGPFGGFFASGFKRAFKIKDFGDTIPGHGGFMDRFDCQLLMATFVNVYYSSFIRAASPGRLLAMVYHLKPEQQLQFYNMLTDGLTKRHLLPIDGGVPL